MRRMAAQKPEFVRAVDPQSGSTALHLASTPDAAAFLLDHGADVNAPDKQGRTPLFNAVLYGEDTRGLFILELLVARGADLNRADFLGGLPLHLTVATRNRRAAVFLQSQGARDTTTPLFDAIAQGDAPRVKSLLQEKPALLRDTLGAQTGNTAHLLLTTALTPLHAAVLWNRAPVVQALLEARADVKAFDAKGETPMHEAAALGEPEMATLLLDAGADPNARTHDTRFFTNGRSYETGLTPLHLAAKAGALPIAELLLKRGADVDTQTLISGGYVPKGQKAPLGSTPLLFAVDAQNAPLVELLLANDAKANGPGDDGTPLLRALEEDRAHPLRPAIFRRQIVGALLKAKANPNARDLPGRTKGADTALSKAVITLDRDLVSLLLDAGASVNTPTIQGETPLHLAIRTRTRISGGGFGSLKELQGVVQGKQSLNTLTLTDILLQHGADVNARDKRGRTPLFDAAKFARIDMVAKLVARGANVNATDTQGRTPLFEATQEPNPGIVRELLAHGAKVNATDKRGQTPLLLLRANHNETAYDPIAALLREHGGHDPVGALFAAITSGDARAVSAAIKSSPALLEARSSLGETPLTHAIRSRQDKIVSFLVARGANLEARANGSTPIFMAAGEGPPATATLLLQHGAQVNAHGGDEGETPLFWAINNSDAPVMVALLLRAGADVKATDMKIKRTPLHICVDQGVNAGPAVWNLLLRAGANVNARDRMGQTPLHLAAVNDKRAGAQWLLAHGANPNARDNFGWTPLRWAEKGNHLELAALLKQKGGTR